MTAGRSGTAPQTWMLPGSHAARKSVQSFRRVSRARPGRTVTMSSNRTSGISTHASARYSSLPLIISGTIAGLGEPLDPLCCEVCELEAESELGELGELDALDDCELDDDWLDEDELDEELDDDELDEEELDELDDDELDEEELDELEDDELDEELEDDEELDEDELDELEDEELEDEDCAQQAKELSGENQTGAASSRSPESEPDSPPTCTPLAISISVSESLTNGVIVIFRSSSLVVVTHAIGIHAAKVSAPGR